MLSILRGRPVRSTGDDSYQLSPSASTRAWRVATAEERNQLARKHFAHVVIDNRTAVAVVPRPDLRPFFFALPRPEGVSPDEKVCTGGSDGDRLREIDVVEPPLVPFLYLERILRLRRRSGAGRYAKEAKGPSIPPERWAEVAARVSLEGLRAVARDLGVSHETVRQTTRCFEQVG
jgi:hypothetical protein